MITLNKNYQRNIDILKINLDRGMSAKQANQSIKDMVEQFKTNNLYDQEAKNFTDDMFITVIEHFTGILINSTVNTEV